MRLTAALMAPYLALTAALAIAVDRRFLINDVIAILIFTLLVGGIAVGARGSESPPSQPGPDGPEGPPPPDDDGGGGWTPPPAPLPSSDRLRQSRRDQSGHRGDALARHRSHRSHQHRGTRAGA